MNFFFFFKEMTESLPLYTTQYITINLVRKHIEIKKEQNRKGERGKIPVV